jgi:signal transduction histidine kinase
MCLTGFVEVVSDRMRVEHATLAARWFEQLRGLLPVDPEDVFPSESLLDHIPAIILDISAYLRAPEQEAIAANTLVVAKARELGALRHQQRASLHQLLREYQLLGDVLVNFVQDEIAQLSTMPLPADCVNVVSRLHRAVGVLTQETVETFVSLYNQTISAQAERLEQFTRMATHEWRQPLGSLQFAVGLLRGGALDDRQFHRTVEIVDRNLTHLVAMTQRLERLARLLPGDGPVLQEVSLTAVANEAARQLCEMADARGVEVRIAENLSTLTVDVGRLELALLNLLSNAIKYADPNKTNRVVDLSAEFIDSTCRIVVRDNGIGIPQDRLTTIFQPFYRIQGNRADHGNVTGVGLGLSIVSDCVRALGGRIEVESLEEVGTTFLLTLPTFPASP